MIFEGQKICRLCDAMEKEILNQRVLFSDASVLKYLKKDRFTHP